jgi:hypothetical protein
VVTVVRVTLTRVRRPVPVAFAAIALLGLISSLALMGPGTSTARGTSAEREPAARNITVSVNKKTVVKGKKVKLTGAVVAPTDASCAAGQVLDIQRSTKGASYPVVGTVTTDAAGAFKFSIKVSKKARFRVAVAASATCVAAQSPPRTVDVTKPAD